MAMLTPVSQTFLGLPQIDIEDIQPKDLVIVGACECTPYTLGQTSHAADGPTEIRNALAK